MQLNGFTSEEEAADWIEHESAKWITAHWS
jgi:hypothetical protein